MEITEDNEEDEPKIIDPEEAKKLEKQIFNDEKVSIKSDMPFIDDNAVYIDYNPQAALEKLKNFRDATIYERQTYTKHLAEIIAVIGTDVLEHLPSILEQIIIQSDDIIRDFLLQFEPLIKYLQTLDNGIEQIRDILINPLLTLMKSSDIHIKQNSGKELANIALLLNEVDRQKYILVNVLQNAKDDSNEDNRIVAVQQLTKIASCFCSAVCEQFVGLEILSLGDDPQLRVRKESIINLIYVAKIVSQDFFLCKLFPFYKKKCSDNNWGIRKSCAEIIVDITDLSDPQRQMELQAIMIKNLKDPNKWVKIAAYKKIGEFVYAQRNNPINPEIFEAYLKMTEPEIRSIASNNEIPIACAYNFPAVLQIFGKEKWPQLFTLFKSLLAMKNKNIKKPLSSSLHEIAKIIGSETAWKDLVTILNDFLEDYSDMVRYGAVQILGDFLQVFENEQREKMIDVFQVLQQNKKKWRIRELIALQINKLTQIYSSEAIFQYIVPIALKLCQDSVASVRKVASKQIYFLVESLKDAEGGIYLDIVMDQIVALSSYHRFNQRQVFLLICKKMIKLSDIFDKYCIPKIEKLAQDKVVCVRITLAQIIKKLVTKNNTYKDHEKIKEIIQTLSQDNSMDVRLTVSELNPEIELKQYSPVKYVPNINEDCENNPEDSADKQQNSEENQEKQNQETQDNSNQDNNNNDDDNNDNNNNNQNGEQVDFENHKYSPMQLEKQYSDDNLDNMDDYKMELEPQQEQQ